MSHFTLAPHLSKTAQQVLTRLFEAGDSQALGVAECLNTIAQNGNDQATDRYLAGCAKEIRGWADYVVAELSTGQRAHTTRAAISIRSKTHRRTA